MLEILLHWINDGGYHNVNFDVSSLTGQSYNNPESFISSPTLSSYSLHTYLQSLEIMMTMFSW